MRKHGKKSAEIRVSFIVKPSMNTRIEGAERSSEFVVRFSHKIINRGNKIHLQGCFQPTPSSPQNKKKGKSSSATEDVSHRRITILLYMYSRL